MAENGAVGVIEKSTKNLLHTPGTSSQMDATFLKSKSKSSPLPCGPKTPQFPTTSPAVLSTNRPITPVGAAGPVRSVDSLAGKRVVTSFKVLAARHFADIDDRAGLVGDARTT
jgi:hypothetical protein